MYYPWQRPLAYGTEDNDRDGLQKMLRKALGGEVEKYLGNAIAGFEEENLDLSSIDDLIGSILGFGEDEESEESEEEFTEIPGRAIPGPETVDVGSFAVDVPEGWLGVRDLEDTDDEDAPPEFYPYLFYLIKGGETSQDMQIGNPTVEIYYSVDQSVESLMEMNMEFRDDVTDIDLVLDGKDCKAVHTVLVMGDDSIESDMVFIPVSDSSCIRIMVDTISFGIDTVLSINDSDVLAIINSIHVK